MNTNSTFDPQTLADDLDVVARIYARFFSALDDACWDRPVKRGPHEWTLHESVAHLCALNGDGLESLKRRLHDAPYTFGGLESRYEFNAFNRRGIDERMNTLLSVDARPPAAAQRPSRPASVAQTGD